MSNILFKSLTNIVNPEISQCHQFKGELKEHVSTANQESEMN